MSASIFKQIRVISAEGLGVRGGSETYLMVSSADWAAPWVGCVVSGVVCAWNVCVVVKSGKHPWQLLFTASTCELVGLAVGTSYALVLNDERIEPLSW